MSTLDVLDVGQANELKLALRRAGFTNELVKRLCEGDTLSDVRNVLLGHAEITVRSHIIDCDADPFVPEGWRVEQHHKGGSLVWSPDAVELYLSDSQKNVKAINGNKLRKELADKPVLNANVLDYLLAHPHLIPESWKKDEQGRTRYIFFWGTIYRDLGGDLYVRCLYFYDGPWSWHCNWLAFDWNVDNPAALRASN